MISNLKIRVLWAMLAGGLTVAILHRWNGAHFTWWSLAFFLQYCVYGCLGYEQDIFWFFMTIQTMVILGVVFMSGTGCLLFQATESTTGTPIYFWGNFAMHYAPALVALMLTRYSAQTPIPINRPLDYVDILLGHAVFLSYCGIVDPSAVYTCTVSNNWLYASSAFIVSLVAVLRWKLCV